MKKNSSKRITVIMPTYRQAPFICRAIRSLQAQTFRDWELLVINDGSPDNTFEIVDAFLSDKRIQYREHKKNEGLGYCLNLGLEAAGSPLIAYLPSDDVYYPEHLQTLFAALEENPSAVLAYSGVFSEDHFIRNVDPKLVDDENQVQLVQLLHKKTADRWTERSELESDNYRRLFLDKLASRGEFISYDDITCEWVNHPEQRTKIINEKLGGGLNHYRAFYNISAPLRFQSSYGNLFDEERRYRHFRKKYPAARKQLKILLVGELGFNPERVCALEEKGHKLYGLWMQKPVFFNTIGPFPFGNIEDIPYENWEARIQEIKPDVIYGLLNSMCVGLTHEVLMKKKEIPFVFHFKEDPFFCIRYGLWKQLVDLHTLCDGRIYINQEMQDWFGLTLPEKNIPSYILDGDLPSGHVLGGERSPLLSDVGGEPHTVLPGRPMGFEPEYMIRLAEQKIHLHFYGEVHHSENRKYLDKLPPEVSRYLHLHPNCEPEDWVREFSQYDAGWLHLFNSTNGGDLVKANWNELNYPARLSTYAAAGLPMLQKDNSGHLVAAQALTQRLGIGVCFNEIDTLAGILRDKPRMKQLRDNVWNNRRLFQFDHYVDDLVHLFEKAISFSKERARSKKYNGQKKTISDETV